ncbi:MULTISPECIES: hypothetical protein [Halobacteriovorax]|uniref:Uncharacterized protein n=1 Tax=Halobacteriovorax vibrionivorans TaxID=2152716 RepID=A0ABY0IGF6_9BACT|nr:MULTISPECIES: hypothetical protein [Halobacteriovorax]RZF22013.1 hypothetical protein DAY19_10040 [Halobacteriovorax vibrionivorans]TGD47123.1 hypothetical protein EP118_09495 [Halobacteriovorax sp. Y22]
MRFLGLFFILITLSTQAFNLPVVGIGRSGKKHEAYEAMISWCDKNKGQMDGYICRRVSSEAHCSYNTYVCSGICIVGEEALTEEALRDFQF